MCVVLDEGLFRWIYFFLGVYLICMCMCIYVCECVYVRYMCICVITYICACMPGYTSCYMYIWAQVGIGTCMCLSGYIYVWMYMYTQMSTYRHIQRIDTFRHVLGHTPRLKCSFGS
jgi:hypothetical protein